MEHRPDPKLGYWERVAPADGEPYFLNRVQNRTEWEIPVGEEHLYTPDQSRIVDAYDNVMYMSLLDFANHEDAHELIHNGQTLQVRMQPRHQIISQGMHWRKQCHALEAPSVGHFVSHLVVWSVACDTLKRADSADCLDVQHDVTSCQPLAPPSYPCGSKVHVNSMHATITERGPCCCCGWGAAGLCWNTELWVPSPAKTILPTLRMLLNVRSFKREPSRRHSQSRR